MASRKLRALGCCGCYGSFGALERVYRVGGMCDGDGVRSGRGRDGKRNRIWEGIGIGILTSEEQLEVSRGRESVLTGWDEMATGPERQAELGC